MITIDAVVLLDVKGYEFNKIRATFKDILASWISIMQSTFLRLALICFSPTKIAD